MDGDAAVKRTGDMLLGGWKLLNMSCPVCNTALMSKAGRFHCPGCDVPVMTEAEAAFMAQENAKKTGVSADTAANKEAPVKSLEEEKKAYDFQRNKSNMMSTKIGEYLLLGYTLLGEECPRAGCGRIPLMQLKGAKPYCICCENHFVQDSYGAMTPVSHMDIKPTTKVAAVGDAKKEPSLSLTDQLAMFREKEVAAAKVESEPADLGGTDRVVRFKDSTTDPSSMIGEKLLQGWALLEETCSSCYSVPLMQDKKKEMYCVICGYINKPKPTSKEALPVPPVPPQQSRADDGDDGLEDLIDDDAIESYNRSRMSALSATSKRKRSAPVVKTVDGSDAERVLRQKLNWAVSQMERCEDVQRCIQLSKLIAEISHAVAAVQSI